ncbi:hypothetical protein R3P38DRAFT_2520769 [Favolaschia claudopus]|uniref:Uncharacterized protein n=1 Tax=Favolaschia claudopus TaxID=2862362 RepID=A0AAW0C337_9AGAR
MAAVVPLAAPYPPIQFFFYPITTYGISYDISTRPTERDLPQGWNSRRSNTYHHISQHMTAMGFVRNQYSVWVRQNTNAVHTWNTMWLLQMIPPPNKFSSTVKRLLMSRMDHFAQMDVTASIQLGGAVVNYLVGPVPRGLVHQPLALQPPAGAIPANAPFVRPRDTKPSPAANNRGSYFQ